MLTCVYVCVCLGMFVYLTYPKNTNAHVDYSIPPTLIASFTFVICFGSSDQLPVLVFSLILLLSDCKKCKYNPTIFMIP